MNAWVRRVRTLSTFDEAAAAFDALSSQEPFCDFCYMADDVRTVAP